MIERVHRPYLAAALINLAARRANVGHHAEALAAAQESTAIYRMLAAANSTAYRASFAGALSNLASRLDESGRRREAVVTAREALLAIRDLGDEVPAHLVNVSETLYALIRRRGDGDASPEEVER